MNNKGLYANYTGSKPPIRPQVTNYHQPAPARPSVQQPRVQPPMQMQPRTQGQPPMQPRTQGQPPMQPRTQGQPPMQPRSQSQMQPQFQGQGQPQFQGQGQPQFQGQGQRQFQGQGQPQRQNQQQQQQQAMPNPTRPSSMSIHSSTSPQQQQQQFINAQRSAEFHQPSGQNRLNGQNTANAPSNGGQIDQNAQNYRRYLLYIVPDNVPSQKAISYSAPLFDSIQIINVNKLQPNEKPPWLTGVPILIDQQTKNAYKGTNAINFLEKFAEQKELVEIQPMFSPMMGKGVGYAIGDLQTDVSEAGSTFSGVSASGLSLNGFVPFGSSHASTLDQGPIYNDDGSYASTERGFSRKGMEDSNSSDASNEEKRLQELTQQREQRLQNLWKNQQQPTQPGQPSQPGQPQVQMGNNNQQIQFVPFQ